MQGPYFGLTMMALGLVSAGICGYCEVPNQLLQLPPMDIQLLFSTWQGSLKMTIIPVLPGSPHLSFVPWAAPSVGYQVSGC